MNEYELLYIVNPTLTEEQQTVLSERIKKHIEAEGGIIDSIDDWGMRRLAYPIQKLMEGHYILLNLQSDPKHINTVSKQLRLLQGIMRFVLVRREKKKPPLVRKEK